jgi:hypothetical protein
MRIKTLPLSVNNQWRNYQQISPMVGLLALRSLDSPQRNYYHQLLLKSWAHSSAGDYRLITVWSWFESGGPPFSVLLKPPRVSNRTWIITSHQAPRSLRRKTCHLTIGDAVSRVDNRNQSVFPISSRFGLRGVTSVLKSHIPCSQRAVRFPGRERHMAAVMGQCLSDMVEIATTSFLLTCGA